MAAAHISFWISADQSNQPTSGGPRQWLNVKSVLAELQVGGRGRQMKALGALKRWFMVLLSDVSGGWREGGVVCRVLVQAEAAVRKQVLQGNPQSSRSFVAQRRLTGLFICSINPHIYSRTFSSYRTFTRGSSGPRVAWLRWTGFSLGGGPSRSQPM